MTKGLNIVSRLTFENIPDGTLPTSIPDENQYNNYSYTKSTGTITIETIDGIKFIKLNSVTAKIYSPFIITDQSKKNFQAEFDVIFDTLKVDTHLVSIGVTTLANALRVVASNNPAQGLRLINGNNQISSYYRFENNKKYTICVGFKDNVISMYVNGTIIGYFYSEEFINSLNVTTPSNIILGAPLNNTNDINATLYGKLGNINISSGPSVKHEESYTKYGTNLVSFLNFENLAGIGTYKTGVEAVYEGIEWRGVESAAYSNGYGNIKNISTNLTGDFTVMFSLKKFKIVNANILKYGHYSVDYVAGFIPVPDPDVIVNDYTTAALNFENGLVDQIGTTVWNKEGTADVTSANKIFGENSFETKALGDSLYTNSNIITGGSVPFTIEFYALISGGSNGAMYPLFTKSNNGVGANGFFIDSNTKLLFIESNNGNFNKLLIGRLKNNLNEIIKHTFTYDGSALRHFINDDINAIVGKNIGFDITANNPYSFLNNYSPSYSNANGGTNGIIDNINIHDGIATKVRDPDPYEEFLVVDLAFDGENNSTKIVDNGNKRITDISVYVKSYLNFNSILNDAHMNWTPNGDISISSTDKKFGISSLYGNGGNLISDATSDITIGTNDYSISFFYKPTSLMDWRTPFQKGVWNSAGGLTWIFGSSSTKVCADGNDSGAIIHGMSNHNWYHVALCRKNGIAYLHINGILKYNWNQNYNLNNTSPLEIFKGGGIVGGDVGFIDDFVYVVGYAMYHGDFIPPTREFNNTINEYNKWTANGNAKLSTAQKFDGFSSLYVSGGEGNSVATNFNEFFRLQNSTLKFDVILSSIPTTGNQVNFISSWNGYNNKRLFYFIFNNISGTTYIQYGISLDGTNNAGMANFLQWQWIPVINRKYSITLIVKDDYITLYIDGISLGTMSNTLGYPSVSQPDEILIGAMKSNTTFINGLDGYLKNFKIYKGVAVIPENPTGKIQLDFDNNVVDKYGNSTWTNNGVTFDQANSVKGSAAYFGNSSSDYLETNSSDLNFLDKNFKIGFDIKNNSYVQAGELLTANSTSSDLNSSRFFIYCNNVGGIGLGLFSNNDNTISGGGLKTYENNWYNFNYYRINNLIVSETNGVIHHIRNLNFNLNINNSGFRLGKPHSTFGDNSGFVGYIDNFKTYKEDFLNDIDIYKTNESSTITISGDMLRLYSTASNGIWFKNKDCPNVKDFIFKTTIIKTLGEQSIILRTSKWRNVNDTYAYLVVINGATIGLAKGSNSLTTTSFSWLKQSTSLDSTLTKYNIEVIANDNNIKIYCNDVLYIDYTGSDYLNSGLVGFRSYGVADYKIDYYSIEDLNNNIIYYKDWKSKVNNVIDRPAVHLPLETNVINTGFTPLIINSVGSPTYTTVDGKKCIKFESGKYLTINSNNIFNLGTSSDFYIEFDFYLTSITKDNVLISNGSSFTGNTATILQTNNNVLQLFINNNWINLHTNILDRVFYNIAIHRKNNILQIKLNSEILSIDNGNVDFSVAQTNLGSTPWYGAANLSGYMSNFKMFVGTSQPSETYNDKKVLDLDFKPTGKSYLFKDNNNKCVIHPVNITQRDYQDSQYCCTFNGVDQYLQLGKNDLFNFGFDDFVINIKFKIHEYYNGNSSYFLLHSGETLSKNERFLVGVSGTSSGADSKKIHFITTSNNITQSIFGGEVPLNQINDLLIYRSGGILYLKLNDDIISKDFNYSINGNLENNTLVGYRKYNSTTFFKGTIYSIKVLRNTTDLSLLEDENTDVIIGDTTLTLSNGTDSQEVIFDNKDQNDFRFVHSNDSTKLIVNEQILEVPNVENELNELSLFTDFNAEAKDIKTYNIAFEDEDTFSGNVPIHTQFGEIEEISTLSDEFIVVDQGDFIVKGFFEGRPEDSRYQIQNRFDKFIVHTGSGPFNYNGLNERFIDDYEIYLPDTKEAMPIPTETMIRGYITVSITPTECDAINFGVKVFRRSDNKLIGIYDFNNYICTIDNLDCNKRYDCIIFDQDVNLESRCLSNRTPIPY